MILITLIIFLFPSHKAYILILYIVFFVLRRFRIGFVMVIMLAFEFIWAIMDSMICMLHFWVD
ncbi:hypothetical protein Hanom_Chr02g00128691 [Helianthus anomalus]